MPPQTPAIMTSLVDLCSAMVTSPFGAAARGRRPRHQWDAERRESARPREDTREHVRERLELADVGVEVRGDPEEPAGPRGPRHDGDLDAMPVPQRDLQGIEEQRGSERSAPG